MTDEAIRLVQELGFPIALSIGLAFVLYKVIMWLIVEKVDSVLKNFEKRHEVLLDKIDANIDKTERCEKYLNEIKSDLKVYTDITMKGK